MLFKEQAFKIFENANKIYFTGASYALNLEIFKEFLKTEIGLDSERMELLISGCTNCWNTLGSEVGNENVIKINNEIRRLDGLSLLDDFIPKESFTGKNFKNQNELMEYLENNTINGFIVLHYKHKTNN